MAEVQMIQSRERSVESKAGTKSSSSTEFSDLLQGFTKSASKDRQITDTKQQDKNTSTDKEDSKKLDSDQKGSVQENEKTETKDTKEEKSKISLEELTGEDFAQLAEMLAVLSKEQYITIEADSTKQSEAVAEISTAVSDMLPSDMLEQVKETALLQDTEFAESVSVQQQDTAGDMSAPQTEILPESLEIGQTEMLSKTSENGQTASYQEATEQMQGESPLNIEASDEEAVSHTQASVRVKTASEEETEEIHTQQEVISAAASSSHTEVSFIDRGNHVEKMTMKTSPENLTQDLTQTVLSKNVLQEGQPALEITLEPAVLGKITLRVVYQEGRAALSLISDSPKTLELLSQKAGEIAQILQENTGQETVVIVPEQSYTEQGQEDNGQQGGHGGRQQQERPKQEQTESFAQQLRLGLL